MADHTEASGAGDSPQTELNNQHEDVNHQEDHQNNPPTIESTSHLPSGSTHGDHLDDIKAQRRVCSGNEQEEGTEQPCNWEEFAYDDSLVPEPARDKADAGPLIPATPIGSGCHLNQRALLASIKEVQQHLAETDRTDHANSEFVGRLGEMVGVLNTDMENLRAYCQRAQSQLETIREPIKLLTDQIFKKMPSEAPEKSTQTRQVAASSVVDAKPVDGKPADGEPAAEVEVSEAAGEAAEEEAAAAAAAPGAAPVAGKKDATDQVIREPRTPKQIANLAELELDVHQKKMQHQLARINDELLRMEKLTVETQVAVVDASMIFVEAVEVAKLVQAELEEILKKEQEEKTRLALLEKMERERLLNETLKRLEQERLEQELIKQRELEANQWPTCRFELDGETDFDGGICCLIRADPLFFQPLDMLICERVDLLDAKFQFLANEEIVSHVIRLTANVTRVKCPITVWIPHCLPRHQVASREVFVKLEVEPGKWEEIPKSHDATVADHKELRFAVAEIKTFTQLVVVSRFKIDQLKFKKKKGGKLFSKVDGRVSLTTEPQTYATKEKISIQMQPVEAGALQQLKEEIPEAKELLCASSIFDLKWSNPNFTKPIIMRLPVPIHPVTLKKMNDQAAAKADKEEKAAAAKAEGDKPKEEADEGGKEKVKPDKGKSKSVKKDEGGVSDGDRASAVKEGIPLSWLKPVKWIMGQYVKESEDERDIVYFLRKSVLKQKWVVDEVPLEQIRLDMVEFTMKEAFHTFIILRTSIHVTEKEVEKMMNRLYYILNHQLCCMIIKQRTDDPSYLLLYVVPRSKNDHIVKMLHDKGYDTGPEPSDSFKIAEGDQLDVFFRGNIKFDNLYREPKLGVVFSTNLDTHVDLEVVQSDIYVQKGYDVYRGFIQLRLVTFEPVPPPSSQPQVVLPVSTTASAPPADDHSAEQQDEETEMKEEELPPQPSRITKFTKITELLVTYPKDLDLLTSKPLRKIPLSYIPTFEAISEDVLARLASNLGAEWKKVAGELGVKRSEVAMLERNAMLQSKPLGVVKFEMMEMWVKKVAKYEDKTTILCQALSKCGRGDLCQFVQEIKKNFEPVPPALARLMIEESGKVSRGVQAILE